MIARAIAVAVILFAGMVFAFVGSPVVTTCLLAGLIVGLLAGFAAGVCATLFGLAFLFTRHG